MTVKAVNFFHGVVFLLFILTISSGVLCGFWRRVQRLRVSFSSCFRSQYHFLLLRLSFFISFRLGVDVFSCFFLSFCLAVAFFSCFFLSFRLGVAFFSCFFLSFRLGVAFFSCFFLLFCLGLAVQLSLPSFMLSSFSCCFLSVRWGVDLQLSFVQLFLSVWVEPYKYLLFVVRPVFTF